METARCDHCGEEATIHEYQGAGGQIISELHLCESCAAQLGIVGKEFKGMHDMLKQIAPQLAGARTEQVRKKARKVATCPGCGMTWSDFRQKNLLGCGKCYDAFQKQLGSLIERCHEGATHHVGKVYAGQHIDVEARIISLRKQLSQALSAEQYERAVLLRDELTTLGGSIEPFSADEADHSPGQETVTADVPAPKQVIEIELDDDDDEDEDEVDDDDDDDHDDADADDSSGGDNASDGEGTDEGDKA